MKKFSYLLNVLLIGFIGFQSFKQKDVKDKIPAACTPICMDYSGVPKFRMNSNVLKMMSANYFYGNAPVNHNTLNDAKSVWFSLITLKTFIWQIENAVCMSKKPCKATDSLLGIRIYYARYPVNKFNTLWLQYQADLGTLLPSHANYAKQHTFFMVPTFDINGAHWDFDPFSASFNKKCIPDTLGKTLGGSWKMSEKSTYIPLTSGFMIAALAPNPDPTAKNHGELCPPYPNNTPPCPGAYFQ